MKVLALVIAVALSGCASTRQQIPATAYPAKVTPTMVAKPAVVPETKPLIADPLDIFCAELAKYARAVAVLRDGGMSAGDIGFVIQPRVDVPAGPVIRDVYTRQDIPPAGVESQSYAACRSMSYDKMASAITSAEAAHLATELARNKAELELIKRTYMPKTR